MLFVTGRGSVVGSAISPVVKICANRKPGGGWPTTWTSTPAGSSGSADLDTVGAEIRDLVIGLAAAPDALALGHQEFILTYKSFEPIGPSCLPAA